MRWVGIDEAGYGPNLGPLVMTAVVAEGPDDRPPDLWPDLAATVAPGREPRRRLWVDDSKAIYRGGQGLRPAGGGQPGHAGRLGPGPAGVLRRPAARPLEAGTIADVELSPWLDAERPGPAPPRDAGPARPRDRPGAPSTGPPGGSSRARAVVVGPARFNAGLETTGSKAQVHFAAFAHLLARSGAAAGDGVATGSGPTSTAAATSTSSPLLEVLPDAWIDRGPEGPDLSRYTLRGPGRRLELSLSPAPTPTTAWSPWPRSSARRSASCGWTPSTPTGPPASPTCAPPPATRRCRPVPRGDRAGMLHRADSTSSSGGGRNKTEWFLSGGWSGAGPTLRDAHPGDSGGAPISGAAVEDESGPVDRVSECGIVRRRPRGPGRGPARRPRRRRRRGGTRRGTARRRRSEGPRGSGPPTPAGGEPAAGQVAEAGAGHAGTIRGLPTRQGHDPGVQRDLQQVAGRQPAVIPGHRIAGRQQEIDIPPGGPRRDQRGRRGHVDHADRGDRLAEQPMGPGLRPRRRRAAAARRTDRGRPAPATPPRRTLNRRPPGLRGPP